MLRHSLKRIRNAVLTKYPCRKKNATTSSGEVWDDPWQAAISKTGINFCCELTFYLENIILFYLYHLFYQFEDTNICCHSLL
ncbi:unnamed protein product [Brugia pahangi]|uniref:Ovule protein n=1 Tax=Brugia pahangi TaxID=6280 RepID=A0A0N4TWL9_BRUPA|nr:unnamed protein product [Brugia pahangi]